MGLFSGFMSLMQQGGWDMWLLLLISIVGLAVVIERLVFFQTQHSDTKGLLRQIGRRYPPTISTAPIEVCKKNRGMLPRILEFGLRRGEKNRADITDALSIALMEHLNSLERNLAIIGTIAVIAPFVGLFGTVLGIIRAFQDIALKGNSTPAVVAAGVSEALITTATRSDHRGHRGGVLQLLQVAHQDLQPGDDRRRQPARRNAALPQHRRADSDRALSAFESDPSKPVRSRP